jgi:hypothetical protein
MLRPKADILVEVREAAEQGRREVQLLGQIILAAPDRRVSSGLLEGGRAASSESVLPARTPACPSAFSMRCAPKIAATFTSRCSLAQPILEAMQRRLRGATSSLSGASRHLPDVALSTDTCLSGETTPLDTRCR